jgi:hypothetical protein
LGISIVATYAFLLAHSIFYQVKGWDPDSNTRTTLANLEGTFDAFQTARPTVWQPAAQIINGGEWSPDASHPINVWTDGDPRNDPKLNPQDPIDAPGDVTLKTAESGLHRQPARYCHDAIANTQKVIILLRQSPGAMTLVAGVLPGSRFLKGVPAGLGTCHLAVATQDGRYHDAAANVFPWLPLDDWGNPIIFVPSGGLRMTTATGRPFVVTSPRGGPFWASAGPDGDLSTPDDNVYSFNAW